MKTFMLPILFAFALASCTKDSSNPAPIVEHPTTSNLPVTVNKTLLLDLVNEVRKKGCQCGDTYYYPVPPITWNNQLELAAYNHSKDMYQNNFFNHKGSDGSTAGVRIERSGYKWMTYGENIAQGYTSERAVIEGWLKSPGHCKNIMKKAYKEMGVARLGNYWTQELGAK